MYKDILKRGVIQVIIYLVIFYLIPYISITFLPESLRDVVTSLFLVVFDLLIIIIVSSIDSYKYKLNWFLFIIPALLFIPTIDMFYGGMELIIYSVLYAGSYGIGMLLGWSYRIYGHQLKVGTKKIYSVEKEKAIAKREEKIEKEKQKEEEKKLENKNDKKTKKSKK